MTVKHFHVQTEETLNKKQDKPLEYDENRQELDPPADQENKLAAEKEVVNNQTTDLEGQDIHLGRRNVTAISTEIIPGELEIMVHRRVVTITIVTKTVIIAEDEIEDHVARNAEEIFHRMMMMNPMMAIFQIEIIQWKH